jgi:hypothetical protein
MFLKIPVYKILGFDMLKFAEHVLDATPCATRSQERPLVNAVNAIASAVGGIAEMLDSDATFFQAACGAVEYPKLMVSHVDPEGKPVGEPFEVPRSAFRKFHEAVENMTAERPAPEKATTMVDVPVSSLSSDTGISTDSTDTGAVAAE